MSILNSDIVDKFNKLADLLEIGGDNPFRVRAYRDAARTIAGLAQSVPDLIATGKPLTDFTGIGKDLAGKIREIVETGKLSQLEELQRKLPPGLHDLLRLPKLGPKKVKVLYDQLNIADVQSLKTAALDGKIRELQGFGAKTEASLLAEIDRRGGGAGRLKWVVAEEIARAYVAYLKSDESIRDITVAGSYRRGMETVGDLDILATAGNKSEITRRFVEYEDVAEVLSQGSTRSSVTLRTGLQVDLRVLPQASYGAALHYFTGSKAHNIAVRKLGQKKNLKINEYGVFKKDKRIAGETENEIFEWVGLPYIEPELREDRGEIEAARRGRLPVLIELEDIRGDLHAHTTATDGRDSLEDMVSAARSKAYSYLAISNHSRHVAVAGGLDEKRLAKQIVEIERFNARLRNFDILKSIEVDILKDGSLDLPNEILRELDLVVCSVHSDFTLPRQKQTERIVRAMDNPVFNILAHPTGRLINTREPYEIDMERLIEAAAQRGCFLELNAHPDRLDLNDIFCKSAKDRGVKVAVSTDAHSIGNLDYMRLGIRQARRGWLEADDVLNTRSWPELKAMLKRN